MPLPDDPARAFMPYPPVPVASTPDGPLSDLHFAVKDLFDVAGYPTSAGSPTVLALSGIKSRHATAVQRLLDAGARFVGKTITDEFAYSMNGRNAHFGTPVNGAAPERIPGGSSSGSAAAVSNRLCDFALGSDTGGSVRAPASHCGLYGLRPTHGRIPLDRCFKLAPSFDTCGFFARDAVTFSRVAEVLLGPDSRPLPERPRLLWAEDAFALLDQTVADALAPAVERVARTLGEARNVVAGPPSLDALHWAFRHLQGEEAWREDGPLIERYRPPLGPGVAERFAWARSLTAPQIADGRRVQADFQLWFAALLGNDGVLVLPTMPDVAPLLSESEEALDLYRHSAVRLLSLAGLSGFPQVTIPLAQRLGAPLGLSLVGPAGADRSLVGLTLEV